MEYNRNGKTEVKNAGSRGITHSITGRANNSTHVSKPSGLCSVTALVTASPPLRHVFTLVCWQQINWSL